MHFLKCGVTGWCMEVVFTSVESILAHDWRLMGRTSLLVDRWIGERDVSVRDRTIRHGMLYMVLIFVGEYLSGAWLRSRGICPWDYSGSQTSINGLIRLDFAPLWFGAGLLFERITRT